jgi:hypothetical protein
MKILISFLMFSYSLLVLGSGVQLSPDVAVKLVVQGDPIMLKNIVTQGDPIMIKEFIAQGDPIMLRDLLQQVSVAGKRQVLFAASDRNLKQFAISANSTYRFYPSSKLKRLIKSPNGLPIH